jgi:hypothetical protein
MQTILALNGQSSGGATISVADPRTTGTVGYGCNSAYSDSARVIHLSEFNAAIVGAGASIGTVGAVGEATGGLWCNSDDDNRVALGHPAQLPPSLDFHA